MRIYWELSWKLALVVFIVFIATMYSVWAGTYNIYFNNAEQGPGSTATPTVNVGGPAAQFAPVAAVDDAGASAPKLAPPVMAPAPATAATAKIEPSDEPHFRRFRVSLAYVQFDEKAGACDGDCTDWENQHGHAVLNGDPLDDYYGPWKVKSNGPMLGLQFFPLEQLGLTGFLGNKKYRNEDEYFFGGEASIVPVRASFFGVHHILEPALVTGGGRLRAFSRKADFYAGARLAVFTSDAIGVHAAWRRKFGEQDLSMLELGVTVRL